MARHAALLLLALLAGAAFVARAAADEDELPAAVALEELTEAQVEQAQKRGEPVAAEDAAEVLAGPDAVDPVRRSTTPDLLAAAPAPEVLIAPAPAPEVSSGRLARRLVVCQVAGRASRLLAAVAPLVTAALPATPLPPQEATARRLLGVKESPLGRRALLGTLTVNISQGDVWKYQVGAGGGWWRAGG